MTLVILPVLEVLPCRPAQRVGPLQGSVPRDGADTVGVSGIENQLLLRRPMADAVVLAQDFV